MIKKIFFIIILLILFFDLYQTVNFTDYIFNKNHNNTNNFDTSNSDSDSSDSDSSDSDSSDSDSIDNDNINDNINNSDTFVNNQEDTHKNNISEEETNNININQFGKPYDYKINEFIHWEFYDPKPWTKIIYTYSKRDPYHFYIKVKIPSLNDYENWINYLTNIHFDPRSGEIIISCEDEETALSIANLIISNFKGDIKFDEIINKNLVGVSVIKCKKYEIVKNKLKEQIIQNMIVKTPNFNDLNKELEIKQIPKKLDDPESNNYFYYENNVTNKNNNEYNAYDGNEYSFLS